MADLTYFQTYLDMIAGIVETRTSFTVLAGQADGSFMTTAMPWLDQVSASRQGPAPDPTAPDQLPTFILVGHGDAGAGRGPDLIAVSHESFTGRSRAVRLRSTAAWKPPVIPEPGPYLSVSQYAPGFRGGPGIAVGDQVVLQAFSVYTPEAVRGASLAHVRFILDSNGDGQLDAGDLILGDATTQYGYDWQLRDVPVDQAWMAGAVNGRVKVFLQLTDSMGVSTIRALTADFRAP